MPHPRRQTLSNGAFSLMATTETSATTVYWENVDTPISCEALLVNGTKKICDEHAYEVKDLLSVD